MLCHVQDRKLRVLDLHRSAADEIVVDIRRLLREAVAPELRARWRYRFQVVHHSCGLVSCVYTSPRPDVESWLVVLDVRGQRIVTTKALESTYKLFVRNDDAFLYFGTHSEFGEDGFRRWVLMSYDIKANEWFDQKIHLMDMVGSDINQSICFEIIDGCFYGLSNQTSFEVDEVDWTSYYHSFRFPVGSPYPEYTQRSIRGEMWRREHAEGPIDDRWSFMRLLKNEKDGRLQILESRKEWLGRRSSGQRAYYTTDLLFAPLKAKCDVEKPESAYGPGNGTTSTSDSSSGTSNHMQGGNIDLTNGSITGNGSGNSANNDANISGGSSGGHLSLTSSRTTPPTLVTRTNYQPPPQTTDNARLRDPYNTHIGDDASTALLLTFSKVPVRSYHQPSEAFLDLIDNPDLDDPSGRPRLQLRAGARLPVPADTLRAAAHDTKRPHNERIRDLYADDGANRISLWPPAAHEASALGLPDEAAPELDLLGKVVSPPTHVGGCRGAWDERSMVYSTGNNVDGMQAVMFVGFDPAMRLRGIRRWGGHGKGRVDHVLEEEGRSYGEEEDGTPVEHAEGADVTGTGGEEGEGDSEAQALHGGYTEDTYISEAVVFASEEVQRETGMGRGKEVAAVYKPDASTRVTAEIIDGGSPRSGYASAQDDDTTQTCSSAGSPPSQESQLPMEAHETLGSSCRWAWTEPAMYQEIAFGYDHLPDFTKAREDARKREQRAAAAAASVAAAGSR